MKEEEVYDDDSNDEEELYEHYKFTADKGQEMIRVDKFLMVRIPNTSRTKVQSASKNQSILVNGKPVKASYKVKPEDEVSVVMPYPIREVKIIPEDIPIEILYEDDHVVVINKEAGMVVHPGYGNYTGTLVNALLYHIQNLPDNKDTEFERPGLVHRLDKNTTGIMVIAKTEDALAHLAKQFFERTTKRTYNALVWGNIEEDEGTFEGNLGRSLKNRKIMQVFDDPEIGKPAITHYKVLERFGYVTLVECKLETGRTHQIRIHFKHFGHPLFGDPQYGGDKILKGTKFNKYKQFIDNCFQVLPRQALHAKSLGFIHPHTGEEMFFENDLPEDMRTVIEKWKNYVQFAQK